MQIPGGWSRFRWAVGLGWFGIAEEVGLAMGVVMGGASLAAVALLGLLFLRVEGIGLRELRAWAERKGESSTDPLSAER